jgi:hypothetical protein
MVARENSGRRLKLEISDLRGRARTLKGRNWGIFEGVLAVGRFKPAKSQRSERAEQEKTKKG